ncbi:MAG TPA: NAD(P)H-binding protein [Acidobacteriaceae bacterium]
MRILLFGASGMVGQGVLRECLLDAGVTEVTSVVRKPMEEPNAKLREIVHENLFDLSAIQGELAGFDACFFCVGVSSVGMKEDEYRRLTYEMTMAVARTLVTLNPQMTFVYVSGAGTDSTEHGKTMWARVKGRTENELLRLPFKAAYMFRPGAIEPMDGIRSKTKIYNLLYQFIRPFVPMFRGRFPKYLTTTRQVGQAMLHVAKVGFARPVLESEDINRV